MTISLKGLRILNTRPKGQAQALNKEIIEAGGVPVECPALEIISSQKNWIAQLPDLSAINQAIFVSPNAVRYSLSKLVAKGIHWPTSIRVIAIGKGTAKALTEFHIPVNDVPELPNSEHLITLDSLQEIKNQQILLVKGEDGRKLIEEYLLSKDTKLHSLTVYKRIIPMINKEFINSLWRNDLVDIILLTSEHSLRNLFKMFSKEGQIWLQNKPCLVISDRLAKTASLFGIKKILVSHPDRMINTLFDYKD
ncbi:uroporphyrinogen-III synthase [Legionella norrlandica]|uniref:Uroporphyrinogen-III synthase n=1 Tax=Legionella norrlandica TaxID=1498499 RepID=A0A0A2T4Q8_9GAMM|nr:uroporphyrinogen-III synthase [Legionella norrlandica]KGP62378.1 uroporphyrinogen-III synthase [Legionella norrlandica]